MVSWDLLSFARARTLGVVIFGVLWGVWSAAARPGAAAANDDLSCTTASRRVLAGEATSLYCAIDVGSNNAKLQVVALRRDDPRSFEHAGECHTRLGLGAKVFDPATGRARPLSDDDIDRLVAAMRQLAERCARQGATLVGAGATQWARDATNMPAVVARVREGTGLTLSVLSPEEEGLHGYVAATHNVPGRVALDPGSNSLQLTFWPKGATRPASVSLPLGYVRAAALYYRANGSDGAAEARRKHARELRGRLDRALGRLRPAWSLTALRRAVAAGRLEPTLFVAGQDGGIHLATRGDLRLGPGRWIDTKDAYRARVEAAAPTRDPLLGDVSAVLSRAELAAWLSGLAARRAESAEPDAGAAALDDFSALRAEPVRSLYGAKFLANTTLLEAVMSALGLERVVLVPQEAAVGFVVARVAASGGGAPAEVAPPNDRGRKPSRRR